MSSQEDKKSMLATRRQMLGLMGGGAAAVGVGASAAQARADKVATKRISSLSVLARRVWPVPTVWPTGWTGPGSR